MKLMKIFFIFCCVLTFSQISFASEKIGVVDIQALVNSSESVKALKNEHNAQLESLNSIITEAQNAIAQENDPQKIVMLQDKYNSEFNKRKEIIENQYKAKLTSLEESIRNDIVAGAKKNNYDIVIAKSVIFSGGEDITELILKDIR